MNFNLSEEQTLIRDSIERFVAENYAFDQRNANVALEHGFNPDHWQQFAELGWLSIPFEEEYGGFGGGPVDNMVIMHEFGKGLVAEPYLATVLLFGGLLQAGAAEAVKSELLPLLIGGELHGAFAYLERQSRYQLTDITTRATKEGADWVINGEKTVVLNASAAHKYIVAARASGQQNDEAGITLFLVDAQNSGIERTDYRMTDGQTAANIRFTDVTADAVLGTVGEGYALMRPVIDQAMLAIGANALGAMEALNAQTLEHCKTRQQFGVHIGSFQALQHRLVDMFAACENQRSLLYRAVCAVDDNSADAQRSILALKVMTGKAGKLIGGEAIQLHGGMGMTNELPVGFYVKRLMILNVLFGDADHHQRRFAQLVNAQSSADAGAQIAAA